MGNQYTVDLEELDHIVGQIGKFDAYVERQLVDLDARIARMHQVWTGDAADVQRAAHREWMAAAADMRRGLQDLRTAAATAHRNYSAAIAANQRMWQQVV